MYTFSIIKYSYSTIVNIYLMYILWNKLWAKAINIMNIIKYLVLYYSESITRYKICWLPLRRYLEINLYL